LADSIEAQLKALAKEVHPSESEPEGTVIPFGEA